MAVTLAVTPDQHWAVSTADLARAAAVGFTGLGIAADKPLDDMAYVQFADALAPESDRPFRETLHRRALPGEGRLELDRFATTLLERGWQGTVSVEVLSAHLRALPVDELMCRLYETAAPFWWPG